MQDTKQSENKTPILESITGQLTVAFSSWMLIIFITVAAFPYNEGYGGKGVKLQEIMKTAFSESKI